MMADLGNGPTTVNGDRSSTYFLVAKAEKEQNGEITAALIENKAGLERRTDLQHPSDRRHQHERLQAGFDGQP
ncbi:MAG: hypothetical protein ACLUGP_07455 [Faecalibacterium prausnitzii]